MLYIQQYLHLHYIYNYAIHTTILTYQCIKLFHIDQFITGKLMLH